MLAAACQHCRPELGPAALEMTSLLPSLALRVSVLSAVCWCGYLLLLLQARLLLRRDNWLAYYILLS